MRVDSLAAATLRTLLLFLLAASGPLAAQNPVWFVVAETTVNRNEAFLLPLTDPQDIANARTLVAQGPGAGVGSIVSARIAAGADGLNRNVRAAGQPLWAWHVTEFEGFADFAIELCDGWPGFVQQDVAGYIANTNGRVCFWGYTVVAELPAPPAFAMGEFLDGTWFNPAATGQGLLIDVMAAQEFVFVGWFTYGLVGGVQGWYTAQGHYTGSEAQLAITRTTGGTFNGPGPVEQVPAGSLTLRFEDCNRGTATYALTGGPSGTFPIHRLVPLASCGSAAVATR